MYVKPTLTHWSHPPCQLQYAGLHDVEAADLDAVEGYGVVGLGGGAAREVDIARAVAPRSL